MSEVDDWMKDLGIDDEVEEVEVEEVEAPKRKKKASKKKAKRKPVVEAEVVEEEEAPKPRRKKKVAKKKATRKPAPVEEAEVVEEAEAAPAPKKRRGPKPGTKRKPRAPKAAAAGNDVLASLRDELTEIANGDSEKARIAELKANIRTAKQLATQLERFSAKVEKAVAAQGATVEKLEAQLDKLNGE